MPLFVLRMYLKCHVRVYKTKKYTPLMKSMKRDFNAFASASLDFPFSTLSSARTLILSLARAFSLPPSLSLSLSLSRASHSAYTAHEQFIDFYAVEHLGRQEVEGRRRGGAGEGGGPRSPRPLVGLLGFSLEAHSGQRASFLQEITHPLGVAC